MNNDDMLLHYDCLAKFEESYFQDLLTQLHIVDHERHIKEVNEKGNDSKVLIDDFCTLLEKGNKKYMMPSKYVNILPIQVKGTPNKYSLKGEVYHFLEPANVQSARFKPEKKMSFKELVDTLTPLKHTNPEHYRLLGMINLSQMIDRANIRIATPAGFGKDSTVDIMGHLFGEAHTIENPTIAKLEMMTYAKLLAVNEVVDISGSEWRNIEQFLLATGAFKNKVTKRSRGYGGVGEILDTSKLSLSLMYNDITHYPEGTKYFDEVTKSAVKDRFPPLRLHGTFCHDFNKISEINIQEYVKQRINKYVDIIRSFYYYKENLFNELHYYDLPPMGGLPERWKTNIGRILKVIDAYSVDQEEFNRWAATLFQSIDDYRDMLRFPGNVLLLAEKLKIPKNDKKEATLMSIKNHLSNRHRMTGEKKYQQLLDYVSEIGRAPTFTLKNLMIKDFQVGGVTNNKGVDKW